jgi:pimeloyl-ACP methyl ester carboxylesterase
MTGIGQVELCRVSTSDGRLLDGALRTPSGPKSPLPIDACLLIHGTGSNFTAPGLLEAFAAQAHMAGIAALRVNTRGHDLMARIPMERGSVLGGAAYENIADCRHDVAAWLGLLAERGYRKIAVVGHSMGGVKAIYTLSRQPSEGVACVVAISPPRFNHAHFQRHKLASQFREDYRRADALVSRGEGEVLLQVRQPMQLVMPASGFVAKYGPHDEYDIVKLLPHVQCPTLVLIGTESAQNVAAFDGLQAELERIAAGRRGLTVVPVEGADISYQGHIGAPFEHMVDWLSAAKGV